MVGKDSPVQVEMWVKFDEEGRPVPVNEMPRLRPGSTGKLLFPPTAIADEKLREIFRGSRTMQFLPGRVEVFALTNKWRIPPDVYDRAVSQRVILELPAGRRASRFNSTRAAGFVFEG